MNFKFSRHLFISFLTLCFCLVQMLPVMTLYAQAPCLAMSAGQMISQSKRCCCCDSSACPCDLKKDQAGLPMSKDLAFTTNIGYQNFEEVCFLREPIKDYYPDEITSITFWVLPRAPCPTIYLATLNLHC
jgi:hypothetical protein